MIFAGLSLKSRPASLVCVTGPMMFFAFDLLVAVAILVPLNRRLLGVHLSPTSILKI